MCSLNSKLDMAKKRMIAREKSRQRLVHKYNFLRIHNKKRFYMRNSLRERLQIHTSIQKLPRSSSHVRLKNRCQLSGRSRGYYRYFGLSRHFFREFALQGILPGIRKSSW